MIVQGIVFVQVNIDLNRFVFAF